MYFWRVEKIGNLLLYKLVDGYTHIGNTTRCSEGEKNEELHIPREEKKDFHSNNAG